MRSEVSTPGLSTDRIQTLADGVFAVAMTLLILDVQPPKLAAAVASGQLPHRLLDLVPNVVTFVFSFIILGVYWVGHHNQYHYIKRADRTFFWINIFFLITVAFIPFSAALIARYHTQQIAVVIYAGNLILTGITLYAHWRYATKHRRLVDPEFPDRLVRIATRRIFAGPIAYLIAIALSFVSTWISLAIYVLVPAIYILPGPFDRRLFGTPGPGIQPSVDAPPTDLERLSALHAAGMLTDEELDRLLGRIPT